MPILWNTHHLLIFFSSHFPAQEMFENIPTQSLEHSEKIEMAQIGLQFKDSETATGEAEEFSWKDGH